MKNDPIYSHNTRKSDDFPLLVLDVKKQQCFPENEGFLALHWHEEVQFIYVLEGRIRTNVFEETVEVSEGEALFINKNAVHLTREVEVCHYHSFIIPVRLFAGNLGESLREKYVDSKTDYSVMSYCLLNDAKHSKVLEQLKKLDEIYFDRNHWKEKKDPFREYRLSVQIMELWSEMLPLFPTKREGKSQKEYERIQRMLMYLHEHYDENITIKELSEIVYVSESECQRCFRKYVKASPYQYLKKYRLDQGKRMLEHSKKSITEIAGLIGYNSVSSFIQYFKKEYGMTPENYRKHAAFSSSFDS